MRINRKRSGYCRHYRQALNTEEQVVRDLAFSRLSRDELLNLLTRRMWNSIVRLNPPGWKRSSQPRSLVWRSPAGENWKSRVTSALQGLKQPRQREKEERPATVAGRFH